MLHSIIADPVDTRVVTNAFVERINQDDLKPLVHSILCHPVRVQHTKATTFTANTLLGNAAQIAHRLPFVVALLRLVANLSCLVGARGTTAAVNSRELAEFPG